MKKISILSLLLLVCLKCTENKSDESSNASEIFVADNTSILVYAINDSGNVSPKRTITGLDSPDGIAVDTVNNEIFITNNKASSIYVYNRTDSGNVSSKISISGSNSGLTSPQMLSVVY